MKKMKVYYGDRVYCQNPQIFKGQPLSYIWVIAHHTCDFCEFYKTYEMNDNGRRTHIYCSFEPKK